MFTTIPKLPSVPSLTAMFAMILQEKLSINKTTAKLCYSEEKSDMKKLFL